MRNYPPIRTQLLLIIALVICFPILLCSIICFRRKKSSDNDSMAKTQNSTEEKPSISNDKENEGNSEGLINPDSNILLPTDDLEPPKI